MTNGPVRLTPPTGGALKIPPSQTDEPTMREVLRDYHPEKSRRFEARLAVRRAIERGELIKPERCQRCNRRASGNAMHAHHADYDEPLDVEWLCRRCHGIEHGARTHKPKALSAVEKRRMRIKDVLAFHEIPTTGRLYQALCMLVARAERDAVARFKQGASE